MTKFDLVTIGDNATDAFIKLSEAELNCEIDRPECKICMKFAAKIPYESVTEIPAGGNSSNTAISAAKLGLKTSYLSKVGNDKHGQETIATLQESGVDIELVSTQTDAQTNYNYVLWYQNDRTILVKHEKFVYRWPSQLETPNWIYLSSVSDNDLSLHQEIISWLDAHSETKLAFSPGTFQIKLGTEALKNIYARTEIIFCNRQEAKKIANRPGSEIKDLLASIKKLGPKIAVVTDSENGAYCLDANNNFWQIPVFTDFGSTLERTGAGDAFSSACLSAIFYGQDMPTALAWGAINAASVVTKIGPHDGLLTKEQIEKAQKTKNFIALAI